MSIGCPGRPFATMDPGLDELLPADDAAWDQGAGATLPVVSRVLTFGLDCQIGGSLYAVFADDRPHEQICLTVSSRQIVGSSSTPCL